MPIDLSQLKLQKAVLEVRYEQAFLLWDRAGSMWNEIRKKHPEAKARTVRPNNQQFSLGGKIEAQIELEKAFIATSYPPNDLEAFRTAAGSFFSIVLSALEVANLKRVGFRVFFERRFDSKEASADFILAHVPTLQREGKHFNIEGKVLDPEISIRWEGEAIGCTVRHLAANQRLEMEIPAEFSDVEPVTSEKNIGLLDVDYYAHANTPTAKFNAPALIESWLQVIRRDVGAFIDG